MKTAVFESVKWEKNYLNKIGMKEFNPVFYADELSPANIPADSRDAEALSVFIYSRVTQEVIDAYPALKLITTRSTGFDHIDIAHCEKKGITVCNVPYYGENTVAEHTFALMLSVTRNVHKAYVRTQKNDFSMEGLQGHDLKGKTLGIIGAGRIGLHAIKIARGFGMEVLAYDVKKDTFLEEILDFKYAGLEEVISRSDIISIHTPYNKYTHHIINMENIRLFRKGAILINTARGGCVDSNALLYGLQNGILAGVGLDAFEGEEIVREDQALLYNDVPTEKLKTALQNNILLKNENVVITPHIAFNSQEAVMRILDTSLQNMRHFFEGRPENTVA